MTQLLQTSIGMAMAVNINPNGTSKERGQMFFFFVSMPMTNLGPEEGGWVSWSRHRESRAEPWS